MVRRLNYATATMLSVSSSRSSLYPTLFGNHLNLNMNIPDITKLQYATVIVWSECFVLLVYMSAVPNSIGYADILSQNTLFHLSLYSLPRLYSPDSTLCQGQDGGRNMV